MKPKKLYTIDGDECLTKCYKKNENMFHPRTLQFNISHVDGQCGIESRKEDDMVQISKGHITKEYGTCAVNNDLSYVVPIDKTIMLSYYFDPIFFIKILYNLQSFDAVIKWTNENINLPFNTIKRVHNCAWHIYGSHKDNITDIVLKYYYELAINQWMKDYIIHITRIFSFSVGIENNILVHHKNKDTQHEEKLSDIIITAFFNYNFFVSTINKYIISLGNIVDNKVSSHYKNIKNFVYEHLIDNIKNSL